MFTRILTAASVTATVTLTLVSVSPASASTLAQSTGTFTISFPDIPEGIFVFNAKDDSGTAAYVPDFSVTYDLSTRARANLAGQEEVDVLDSYGPVNTVGSSPFIFVRNFDGPNPDPDEVASGPIILGGFIDYNLSVATAVDDPLVDRARAYLELDVSTSGVPTATSGASPDEATSLLTISVNADTAGSDDEDEAEGSLAFDVLIDPKEAGRFSTIEIGYFFESSAIAEDMSPIPVPAALPLFLTALGGLALLRRRTKA